MGCGVSRSRPEPKPEKRPEMNLRLQSIKSELTANHLTRANQRFLRMLENQQETDLPQERQALRLGNAVERLVQRLICAIGYMDSRFSSKFLITVPMPTKNQGPRLRFRYLVRLDGLSTPSLYVDTMPPIRILQGAGRDTLPAGYARIRVHGEYLEQWCDLINHHGYLRRDKVQERFMQLLATAAGQPDYPFSPSDVDESQFCGSPGKIVDPLTLYQILKQPAGNQCFYGPPESDEARYPDPRDFRIAIVEGVPEIRLHVAFLSTNAAEEDAEIILTLCVGVDDWPQQSDFPSRLPFDHPDILLAYRAAQTGFFLVACGPHHSVRCDDRTSVWEIRTPAANTMLQFHYSETSVVSRCNQILLMLMDLLQSRGMKTINRYILQTLLFWELEKRSLLQDWTPNQISRRVISILDNLAQCLRHQNLRHFLFPFVNLLQQPCIVDQDYKSDAEILENYLSQFLHDRTSFDLMNCEISVQDHLETAMLVKWNQVIRNLKSPINKQSTSYSRRQMEYIAMLFREILKLRQIQQTPKLTIIQPQSTSSYSYYDEFFYLLQSVFEQAKQRAWNNAKPGQRQVMDSYDVSTAMMIDGLRRDETLDANFKTDMQLVAKVIECLHAAVDSDKKILAPILRPYLNELFKGSHENCWFLPEWLKRCDNSEFEAIGAFSNLVLTQHLDPLQGLLDCVSKGWNWAKHALYTLKSVSDENSAEILLGHRIDSPDSGLRFIFAPELNKTIQLNLRLTDPQSLEVAEYLREEEIGRTLLSTLKRGKKSDNCATIRSYPETLRPDQDFTNRKADTWCKLRACSEKLPPHGKLRDASPFTVVSMATRRQGTHRGLGSIVQALISLRKLTILQEIAIHLPDEERGRVLGDIQKLSKEVERVSLTRRRSDGAQKARFSFRRKKQSQHQQQREPKQEKFATLPRSKVNNEPTKEIYKSHNEFHHRDGYDMKMPMEKQLTLDDSLLGTCRILRNQNRLAVEKIDFSGMLRYRTTENFLHTTNYKKSTMMTSSSATRPEMTEI